MNIFPRSSLTAGRRLLARCVARKRGASYSEADIFLTIKRRCWSESRECFSFFFFLRFPSWRNKAKAKKKQNRFLPKKTHWIRYSIIIFLSSSSIVSCFKHSIKIKSFRMNRKKVSRYWKSWSFRASLAYQAKALFRSAGISFTLHAIYN